MDWRSSLSLSTHRTRRRIKYRQRISVVPWPLEEEQASVRPAHALKTVDKGPSLVSCSSKIVFLSDICVLDVILPAFLCWISLIVFLSDICVLGVICPSSISVLDFFHLRIHFPAFSCWIFMYALLSEINFFNFQVSWNWDLLLILFCFQHFCWILRRDLNSASIWS